MPDLSGTPLILYGTSACHLCEQAEAILQAVLDAGGAQRVDLVDISEDDDLMQRYGWRIPVLRRGDKAELDWPFDSGMVQAFLSSR